MTELRWALLILGLLVILGVYLYSRRKGASSGGRAGERSEPVVSGEELWGTELDAIEEIEPVLTEGARRDDPVEQPWTDHGSVEYPASAADADDTGALEHDMRAKERDPVIEGPSLDLERIVAMRVAAPAGRTFPAEEMVLKLRELGLRHGKYGIFHRHVDEGEGAPMFSVANMTEPGSFDLPTLRDTRLPGVSLFMVLPGPKDPVACFDAMVEAARILARDLDGDMLDENGSTWSIQRERYVRENLIRYRLQYARS